MTNEEKGNQKPERVSTACQDHTLQETLINKKGTQTENKEYYDHYCKILYAGELLEARIQELINEKDSLLTRLELLSARSTQLHKTASLNFAEKSLLRKRRKKSELCSAFACSVTGCKKSYASRSALNLHLTRKHGEARGSDHLK